MSRTLSATRNTRSESWLTEELKITGDGDTTVGDFVGEYTQKPDGSYEFIYGPLIRAMQEGRVLFIDDAVRHEAPSDRAEVKGLRRLAVAAAG